MGLKRRYDWTTRIGGEFLVLVGVGLLAIGTRVVFAVLTTSWVFPRDNHSWSFGYEMGQIAASLAMGNGFSWPENVQYSEYYAAGQPTAWMPPVYPFIMAAAFKIFGVFSNQAAIALETFQIIASALTCIVLYFLGKRLYDAKAGLVRIYICHVPARHSFCGSENLVDEPFHMLFAFGYLSVFVARGSSSRKRRITSRNFARIFSSIGSSDCRDISIGVCVAFFERRGRPEHRYQDDDRHVDHLFLEHLPLAGAQLRCLWAIRVYQIESRKRIVQGKQ